MIRYPDCRTAARREGLNIEETIVENEGPTKLGYCSNETCLGCERDDAIQHATYNDAGNCEGHEDCVRQRDNLSTV